VAYYLSTLSYVLKGFYSRNVNYEESSARSYLLERHSAEELRTLETDTSLQRCRSSAIFKQPNYVHINSNFT
jgi:hypothetical protein